MAAGGKVCTPVPAPDWLSLGLQTQLPPRTLVGDTGLYGVPSACTAVFPVIKLKSAAITQLNEISLVSRDGYLERQEGLLYCALIDRRGKWVANGFVDGIGQIESLATICTTSHDLLVLGKNRSAMAAAAAEVVAIGGGHCAGR